MSGDRKLPQRVVRAQTAIVEAAARQVESILAKHQGLTREARQEIREVMDSHLGNLEYFVLVREDSYGEIHTNRLREGIYFKDPVGMKCAQVTETTAFFYPRNTGEQLIDVSTPVHLNGKKVYALRSGSILHGVSRHVKVGGTFACLQLAGLLGVLLDGRGWLAYVFAVCLLGAACVVIWDRLAFQRAYGTWIGFLRKIGQGDLKHQLRPKSRDEFGQMQFELNKMSLGVADILHQVGRSAQQVAAAAEELNTHAEETAHTTEQIALAMQHVSSGSEAQAAEIDVSTRAVQQMSGDIRRMAEHAQIVVNQSNTGSALAARGHERIHRAMEQMTAIHGSTVQLSQAVTALGQRSEEIGQIVDVVAHIAGRTNLLALNAAIESARAGEAGRGFTVIAHEVRSLAEQSAQATRQIATLVQAMQADADAMERAMEETTQETAAGIREMQSAGDAFAEIRQAVTEAEAQMQEISQAIQQLSAGSAEIVAAMENISDIVERTHSEAEEVSAATEEQLAAMEEVSSSASVLSTMSGQLHELMARFQI